MKADAKTEAAVLAAMNKFTAAYQQRDIEGLMGILSPDDDVFLFGTGIDEKWTGQDEFRFQTEALAFSLAWHKISAAGSVAWVAAEGLGKGKAGGQEFEFPMRMTAVLEQRGDKWLLAQFQISLPAPGQEEGNSVPV